MNNYFKSVIIVLVMVFCLGLTAAAMTYNEAPELVEKVEEGTLPSVEDRLPAEPLVVEDVDEIGVYGGDLYMPTNTEFVTQIYASESLVLFKKGTIEIVPGLAKDWEISEDGTEFTFYLREGLKWSDGEPFTTDDLMFWWEDIMNNEELSPAGAPSWIKPGEETEVVKVDSHIIKFIFDDPHPFFLRHLAFAGINSTIPAKHYLKQFHAEYVDEDELAQMVDEGGFDTWDQLFGQKYGNANALNVDHPTVGAWKVVQTLPKQNIILERNPYYYKVDPEGNQLPYIDRLITEKITDEEVVQMKILDGQVDLTYRMTGFDRYTMLKEGEDRGGYKVIQWTMDACWNVILPNFTYKDSEAKRDLYNNVKFRRALSHAIDREELQEIFSYGMGEVYQPVGNKEDPWYVEGTGYTAIEYDPEKANQLLDELGLDKRDEEGYRLLPNGEQLEITISVYPTEGGLISFIETASMLADNYWKDIGLRVRAKQISRTLWREHAMAGEYDIHLYTVGGVNWIVHPHFYVPMSYSQVWGMEWGLWNETDGEEGVEPPEGIKRIFTLYEELIKTADEQQQKKIAGEILKIHDQNLWHIAVTVAPFAPVAVNERLRNVVEDAVAGYRTNLEKTTWPEQLFYVDGKRK